MEKRKNIRIPFAIKSAVKFDEKKIEGTILNISLQGLFIDIPEQIPLDAIVVVELQMDGPAGRKLLQFPGQVVRSGPDESAVKFITMNLDLYIALRDIMMNCSDDPEAVMKEFIAIITGN